MSTGVGKPQSPLDQDTCPSLNLPNAGEPAVDLTLQVSPEASSLWPNVADLTSTNPWNSASLPQLLQEHGTRNQEAWAGSLLCPVTGRGTLGKSYHLLEHCPPHLERQESRSSPRLPYKVLPGSEHSRPGPSSEHQLAPDDGSAWNWTHACSVRDRAELGRNVPEVSPHRSELWLQATLPWGPAPQPPSTSRASWQREQSSSVANTSRQCIVKKSRKRYNNPRHSTSEP